MSQYLYPVGVATGYTGFANLMAGLMTTGITGGPTGLALPAPTGTDGFLQAMCDAVQQAVGHQVTDYAAYVSTGTSSTSFVDLPGSSFSFTPPASKPYVFEVDHTFYRILGTGNANVRVVVGSVSGETWLVGVAVNSIVTPHHLALAAFLQAGVAVTAKLQWFTNPGSALFVDGSCARKWFVRG